MFSWISSNWSSTMPGMRLILLQRNPLKWDIRFDEIMSTVFVYIRKCIWENSIQRPLVVNNYSVHLSLFKCFEGQSIMASLAILNKDFLRLHRVCVSFCAFVSSSFGANYLDRQTGDTSCHSFPRIRVPRNAGAPGLLTMTPALHALCELLFHHSKRAEVARR